MNPAKAAARLNGKVQSWESQVNALQAALARARRPRGTARCRSTRQAFLVGLTEHDIALAFALISSNGARLLGRVMYAGQDVYKLDLALCTVLELRGLPGVDQWTEPGAELLRVVQTAINERIRNPLCVVCHGREYMPRVSDDPYTLGNEALRVVCPECNGQGPGAWGSRTRASHSGMSRKYFENHWAARYRDVILPKLDRYHDVFWDGLKRRMENYP